MLPLILTFGLVYTSTAFVVRPEASRSCQRLLRSSTTSTEDAFRKVDAYLASGGTEPRPMLEAIEADFPSPISEPNRSPQFLGEWHVHWTDCPPPSNGQLGPFLGTSGQFIRDDGLYQNLLCVPPNDWLTAVLDGKWEDWDGRLLSMEDGTPGEAPSKQQDWGADHWKVTFVDLQISLFGWKLFRKDFPPNTSRIWRTTYMDEDTRIVRAGRTGKIEDEYLFYTKRTPK